MYRIRKNFDVFLRWKGLLYTPRIAILSNIDFTGIHLKFKNIIIYTFRKMYRSVTAFQYVMHYNYLTKIDSIFLIICFALQLVFKILPFCVFKLAFTEKA